MTSFQKLAVRSYRYLAIFLLSAVLFGAFSWFGVTGLFQMNKSWAAPILISKTHTRILSLTADAFRTKQAADDLSVKTAALRAENTELTKQQAALNDLVERYTSAVAAQKTSDRDMASRLATLGGAKRADDAKAAEMVKANTELAASIDRELAAGLITAEAAARARAQVVTVEMTATNARLSTAALDRQVHDLKGASMTLTGTASSSTVALDALARIAQFQRELSEVQLKLARNNMELENKERELTQLNSILQTLAQNPYFRASKAERPMPFAFIPYTNESVAQVGQPVYSCYLRVIFCSKVGTITAVHSDEEKLRHPTNNEDIRGFLAELQLDDPLAAKEKVLFIGGGPLFL